MQPSDLQGEDAGTGETLDLTQPHLSVGVAVRRVVVQQPPASSDPDAEYDSSDEPVIGDKTGAGFGGVFKDWDSLANWAKSQAEEGPLRLKLDRSDDSHLYTAAAAESGESGEESGSTVRARRGGN